MKKLQSYELQEVIGAGGMGTVYKAWHTLQKKFFAIKTLNANFNFDDNIKNRFRNEASILSNLEHPNIVKVYDVLEDPSGLHIIMEYIEGSTLEKKIIKESGPIPSDKALPLFRQVLAGIEFAHSKGVIHRDIKPANILITPEGTVKITDFGIAKILDGSEITKTGTKLGTIHYMSPQAVLGEKPNEKTDVYSLGITLYEMLSGKLPFKDYTGSSSDFVTMNKIVNDPLTDPRIFYPHIDAKLVELIFNATQKKLTDRIPSVAVFKQKIEEFNDANSTIVEFSDRFPKIPNTDIKSRENNIGHDLTVIDEPVETIPPVPKNPPNIPKRKPFKKSTKIFLIFLLSYFFLTAIVYLLRENKTIGKVEKLFTESINIQILETKILTGHKAEVSSLAFSTDGKYLASTSWDKTVKIWDVNTGKLLKTLEGFASFGRAVSFNSKGNFLAVSNSDKTIKIWDATNFTLLSTLLGHTDGVLAIDFNPKKNELVSAGNDNLIIIWDLNSFTVKHRITAHSHQIWSVKYNNDGTKILSVSRDGFLKVWSASNLSETYNINLSAFLRSTAWGNLDVEYFAAANTGEIFQGSINKKEFTNIMNHTGFVSSIVYNDEYGLFFSAGQDGKIIAYSTSLQEEIIGISDHMSVLYALAFEPKSGFLASGGEDKQIFLRKIKINKLDERIL